jgi:O-Antigen ligase
MSPNVSARGSLSIAPWFLGGCLLIAAGTVARPLEALLGAVALWCLLCLAWLPQGCRLLVPMFLLLVIPADHLSGLNGKAHGLFALGWCFLLALSSVLTGRRPDIRGQLDVLALVIALAIPTAMNMEAGELRGLLFWAAALCCLLWVRSEEVSGVTSRPQILAAILGAGAVGGALAGVSHAGILDIGAILPGYQANDLEFSYMLGSRAVGLSGHPLRLGSLAMIASIVAISWLVDSESSQRRKVALGAMLGCSILGLVLSGARGAWLALACGLVVITFARQGFSVQTRVVRLITIGACCGALLWLSGATSLVYERMFGDAVHPLSLQQRLEALNGIRVIWSQVPLFGVGFGGTADITARMGMLLPHLENEYLRFYLTGGILAPLIFLVVGCRRIAGLWKERPSAHRTAMLGILSAFMVNVATYNFFSWSVGPSLFVAIVSCCEPVMPRRVFAEGGSVQG